MEKKDCKIIQDLLPNYIEKLTNDETNQFIEEHIEQCNECKTKLKNMQEEINVNKSESELKQVKYIKKYSNKMKLLKTILLVIIIVYLLFVARNAIILMSLSIKANNTINAQNYYAKSVSYLGQTLHTIEYYKKGEDYYTTWNICSKNADTNKMDEVKITYYKKGDDKVNIIEFSNRKEIQEITEINKNWMSDYLYKPRTFWDNIKLAFIVGIETRECNGKECYLIKETDCQNYYDKLTGIRVRYIDDKCQSNNIGISAINDLEYKFNVVQDSDIQRPDTSDAIVRKNIEF